MSSKLSREAIVFVRTDGIFKYEVIIKEKKASKVKRLYKVTSRILYNSLYFFVFHFFKTLNQKARFKISSWHMRCETSEHVNFLTKVLKWVVFPASLLYVLSDFYFFGESALDVVFLGTMLFFYSNFLPDLPSIYYGNKNFERLNEDLLWDQKCAIFLFAPLFVGAFFCGMRLKWHTTETFHNFKSLMIYATSLLLLGLFVFGNMTEIFGFFAHGNTIQFPISIRSMTKALSLTLYGVLGYSIHLKVDKIW